MHILEKTIRAAQEQGRLALIPYITADFPTREQFREHLEALDRHGADVIEIGVPFSDPVADGPVVEAASRRALAQGVTLPGILEELPACAGHFRAPLVLMGYFNPFLQYGLEALARDAATAGIRGCIVPDLPLEESEHFRGLLREQGIALITLVGQNTSIERMREYAALSEGFVYVVSVMGTTGQRAALPPAVTETLRRAREAFNLPLALGFGLQNPAQVEAITPEARPEAVVFGSALLRHLENGGTAADFLHRWTRPDCKDQYGITRRPG